MASWVGSRVSGVHAVSIFSVGYNLVGEGGTFLTGHGCPPPGCSALCSGVPLY